jgi:hypothetical protein
LVAVTAKRYAPPVVTGVTTRRPSPSGSLAASPKYTTRLSEFGVGVGTGVGVGVAVGVGVGVGDGVGFLAVVVPAMRPMTSAALIVAAASERGTRGRDTGASLGEPPGDLGVQPGAFRDGPVN